MDIDNVRAELATALDTISGLRCYAYVPDSISVPAAIIGMGAVQYDETLAGSMTASFVVTVAVGRSDMRSSQTKINDYVQATGATSIKAAVESDPTLNGTVSSVTVMSATPPSEFTMGETSYLSVQFEIEAID